MRALFILVSTIMFMASGSCAFAQRLNQASYSLKASFADAYIFRGHVYHDDATLFGEVGVGMGKWSYRLHYADPIDDVQSNGSATLFGEEYTHEVSYTTVAGSRIMTVGYHFYDYPDGTVPQTQELFTRVAYNTRWNPSYGISYDFDTYKGYYIDFSLTRFWQVTRKAHLVFNLRGGGSYDMTEEGNDPPVDGTYMVLEPAFFESDGINHGSASVKYQWQTQKWLRLETGMDYHYAFDDLLYNDNIARDQLVWRSSITLTMP